jgi:SAM-dependent methyltransferase
MSKTAEFDQFAETYDDDLNQALAASGESKEFFARGRVKFLGRCLAQLNQPAHSVIDYGCGIGDTTPLLRSLLGCNELAGLDVSERSLERARHDHGVAGVRFLSFEQYVPEGSAEVVYCNGVFHHIPVSERPAAVDYIHRSLRPGGCFALWENNPWNPGTQYVMHRCCFDRDAVKISPPRAARMLRNAGFEILRTDYLFFFPRLLRALRSLEPALSRIPLGGQYQVLARKPSA